MFMDNIMENGGHFENFETFFYAHNYSTSSLPAINYNINKELKKKKIKEKKYISQVKLKFDSVNSRDPFDASFCKLSLFKHICVFF